jgi:Polysaccharide biosynthesis protein
MVTGVIAARALGTAGRGALPAVVVPLSTAPYVLVLGWTTSTSRSMARGERPGDVLCTAGRIVFLIGCISILPGWLLADTLASGSSTVRNLLRSGFVLMPILLAQSALGDGALGLQRWRPLTIQRAIPIVATPVCYVALVAVGGFDLRSAGLVVILLGLISGAPLVPLLFESRPLRWSGRAARLGATFSAKASLITLSQLLNHRLDQVLMAATVSRRQLGLYAVAVTVSGVAGMLASAISTVSLSAAGGGRRRALGRCAPPDVPRCHCVGRADRADRPGRGSHSSSAADSAPLSRSFSCCLLRACRSRGINVLAAFYVARDRVGLAGLSEVVAVAVTAAGLLLLLPPLDAMGAALTSLLAYSVKLRLAARDRPSRLRSAHPPVRRPQSVRRGVRRPAAGLDAWIAPPVSTGYAG